ncbi:12174_t:CDS:1, partial [Entrophospora sp. SA101]
YGAYNILYSVLSAKSIDNGKFFDYSKETSPNNLAFGQELCDNSQNIC